MMTEKVLNINHPRFVCKIRSHLLEKSHNCWLDYQKLLAIEQFIEQTITSVTHKRLSTSSVRNWKWLLFVVSYKIHLPIPFQLHCLR